ncbi:MAG: hypothetical protein AABO57_14305 [Acidobacteriota bacterium]
MKRMTQRNVALAVTLVLALASLAMSAPKSERSSKYLIVEGRVLQIDQKARTMLVADMWSDKLYLVNVPKSETFKITFGMNKNVREPEFWQARRNDRIQVRCVRSQEHLARLDGGGQVVVMTAAH